MCQFLVVFKAIWSHETEAFASQHFKIFYGSRDGADDNNNRKDKFRDYVMCDGEANKTLKGLFVVLSSLFVIEEQ